MIECTSFINKQSIRIEFHQNMYHCLYRKFVKSVPPFINHPCKKEPWMLTLTRYPTSKVASPVQIDAIIFLERRINHSWPDQLITGCCVEAISSTGIWGLRQQFSVSDRFSNSLRYSHCIGSTVFHSVAHSWWLLGYIRINAHLFGWDGCGSEWQLRF